VPPHGGIRRNIAPLPLPPGNVSRYSRASAKRVNEISSLLSGKILEIVHGYSKRTPSHVQRIHVPTFESLVEGTLERSASSLYTMA